MKTLPPAPSPSFLPERIEKAAETTRWRNAIRRRSVPPDRWIFASSKKMDS
jgi:hypothetical protein